MYETNAPVGWDSVFQQIARYGLTAAIDSEFIQPFQLERDKTLAQNNYGQLYSRGMPTGAAMQKSNSMPSWAPWLLGGAALLAVVVYLVKD
jgi:hypothetical protein